MPATRGLTIEQEIEYRKEKLRKKIVRDSAELRIKRKDLADAQGITSVSVCNQLNKKTELSLDTVLAWQILQEQKLKGERKNEIGF